MYLKLALCCIRFLDAGRFFRNLRRIKSNTNLQSLPELLSNMFINLFMRKAITISEKILSDIPCNTFHILIEVDNMFKDKMLKVLRLASGVEDKAMITKSLYILFLGNVIVRFIQ